MSNGTISTITELKESRRAQHTPFARRDQEERIFYVISPDEDQVRADLKTSQPQCINVSGRNLWVTEYDVRPIDGNDKYYARIIYKQRGMQPRRQFDIATGRTRIYKSFQTYAYPGTACDYQNAIEVEGKDNSVRGVEVYDATLRYQEIHRLPQWPWLGEQILREWLATIGTTNDAAWRQWKAEEVLFLGFTAVPVPENEFYYDCTFEWDISPEAEVQLPFEILPGDPNYNNPFLNAPKSLLTKPGWRYIWYSYDPLPINSGECQAVLQQPKAAYMERIYLSNDFNNTFIINPCEWDLQGVPELNCPDETHPYCQPAGQQQAQSLMLNQEVMKSRIERANSRINELRANPVRRR